MDSQRRVQPSALHLSPGFHRKDLPPVVLAEVSGLPADRRTVTGTSHFQVGTPDVRCRIKGCIVWTPDLDNPWTQPEDYHYLSMGLPYSRFAGTNVWLTKRDSTDLGGRGHVNVENLAGDIYAGLPIPDRGCLGFVFEVETTVAEIWGSFYCDNSSSPGNGRWVLRAAADGVDPMTEEEWNRVSTRFYLRCQDGTFLANPQT